ncbi:hypothetical protein PF003_g12419 [Phytophthora fragariae]|nr:hypothetical protein PF003_g12419 [Phytophthora fragariae]
MSALEVARTDPQKLEILSQPVMNLLERKQLEWKPVPVSLR